MEGFWKTAVKVTGPVAVVAFIATVLIENVYQEEVIKQFGSDYIFYVTMALIAVIAVALIAAIIMFRRPATEPASPPEVKQKRTAKISKSKINGDFVMGDKKVNTEDKRGE